MVNRSLPNLQRRRLMALGAIASQLPLAACTSDYDSALMSSSPPKPLPFKNLPKNAKAIVLSSGGPRGFVHAGFLKAIDEIGVKPDLLIGASVGSLVGAIYAAGASGKQIADIALNASVFNLATLSLSGKERFSGSPMAQWVNEQVAQKRAEDFPIPFGAVTMRASDRQPVAFTSGDVGVAVQASCAIEGLFAPVRLGDELWIDPDAKCPLPVQIAREMGAVKVLSVDASAHEDKAPPEAARFRESDLVKRRNTQKDVELSDLNLHPFFGYWVSNSREFRQRAIEAGYQATIDNARQISRLFAA